MIVTLVQIEGSENYFDDTGYLHTENSPRNSPNLCFRCKNLIREGCSVRATVHGKDFSRALVQNEHTHLLPSQKDLDNEKFDKLAG